MEMGATTTSVDYIRRDWRRCQLERKGKFSILLPFNAP